MLKYIVLEDLNVVCNESLIKIKKGTIIDSDTEKNISANILKNNPEVFRPVTEGINPGDYVFFGKNTVPNSDFICAYVSKVDNDTFSVYINNEEHTYKLDYIITFRIEKVAKHEIESRLRAIAKEKGFEKGNVYIIDTIGLHSAEKITTIKLEEDNLFYDEIDNSLKYEGKVIYKKGIWGTILCKYSINGIRILRMMEEMFNK